MGDDSENTLQSFLPSLVGALFVASAGVGILPFSCLRGSAFSFAAGHIHMTLDPLHGKGQ